MTVTLSMQSAVKPGRLQDAIAVAHEAEKLCERHGADHVQLLAGTAAGEATGQQIFSMEFRDLEHFGRWSDEIGADPDLLSLQARLDAVDSPVTGMTQAITVEIPTGRTPAPGRGNVVEVHVTRCIPGKLERAITEGVEVCDFVEANGAMNARLSRISYSGSGTGLLMASWEWANMAAWAAGADAFDRDPKGQEIAASTYGADPTTTLVFSALYQVIPL